MKRINGSVLIAAISAVVVGCRRPAAAAREKERLAYAAVLDYVVEADRLAHVCDAEDKAYVDALHASTEALRSGARGIYQEFQHDEDRANVLRKACESRVPSFGTRAEEMMRLKDAWIDACLECADGKACVAADRKLRRSLIPPRELLAALPSMRKRSVCSGQPATSLAENSR
jgi:hypothetical protein